MREGINCSQCCVYEQKGHQGSGAGAEQIEVSITQCQMEMENNYFCKLAKD